MDRAADVVIIGGGPAGATTALALARRGYEVALLDRAVFPREKLCGDYIHPLGAAALDRLGLFEEIRPHAQTLTGMLVVSPAGREVFARFPAGRGLSVSRAILDDAILRAAQRAGVTVETSRAARQVIRHGDRWRVLTDDGAWDGRVLVGADGLHSIVARGAGLRAGPARQGRYAVGLYLQGLRTHEGFGEMHLARDAYCGVSAFPDGRANVTMVVNKAVLRAWRSRPAVGSDQQGLSRHRLNLVLARFPQLRPRILAGAQVHGMRTIGPLAPTAGPVVRDGVVLVGDAAAFTDPLTGQGVSLALTGALVAAETIDHALRGGDVRAPQLARYAQWHQRRLLALQGFLRLVDWIALRTPMIEPLARTWQRHPPLAARFLGVIGNGDPARRVLGPGYVSRLMLACISRA